MAIAQESTLTTSQVLAQSLTLPCGATIPNRVIKGAMTEQLSDTENSPTEELFRLYERWGKGGTGVLLTGNVMVDRRAFEGPRNVAVEDERDLDKLREWANRAQANGSQLWMQISHPGRQTPRGVSELVVAPSAVPLEGSMKRMFTPPRALTTDEIEEIIGRFVTTATVAQKAGFSGIQIHSAHGYLNSQFLSPIVNQRDDEWGGNPEKRMRFLLEIVRRTRESVGPAYPIAVKLNSADFQRGGFSEEDSMNVVSALEAAGIDLLEISGGSYENPVMISSGEAPEVQRESTRTREAFFLEYAQKVRARTKVPLMLTGGLRTVTTMAEIIQEGYVDCVGLARPLAIQPDFTKDAIAGTVEQSQPVKVNLGIKMFDDMLQSLWYQEQMKLMARGKEPNLKMSRLVALAKGMYNIFG